MKSNKALVVNLFGAPGAKVSMMAHGIAYALENHGLTVEVVWDVAKDFTYAGKALPSQLTLARMRADRLRSLTASVDVTITDTPLPIGLLYANRETAALERACVGEFRKFNNMNYFLLVDENEHALSQNSLRQRKILQADLCRILAERDIGSKLIASNGIGAERVTNAVINR